MISRVLEAREKKTREWQMLQYFSPLRKGYDRDRRREIDSEKSIKKRERKAKKGNQESERKERRLAGTKGEPIKRDWTPESPPLLF